ncbi:MAG: cytochrome c [Alphaproteobacteria bacterium]|nr:cytochrome c [Alphaproteobacteria bacterium]
MRYLPLVLLGLIACGEKDGGDSAASSREDDILALTPDTANGQTVFENNCASCHEADGSGNVGPSLQGALEDDALDYIINGEGGMPSFSSLSDQDIADVYAYAESL